MLKLSSEIPEIFNVEDPLSMKRWMIAVKQIIEEITRKAGTTNMKVFTETPVATDFESETDLILTDIGGVRRVNYLVNGSVRYAILT